MKVLICGTHYGASYLRALSMSTDNLSVAGILSTGSQRSQAYANHFGVPHFTDVQQLPDKLVDIACVAISGAAGHAVVLNLLNRGIHVLCEHPIDDTQMGAALAAAQNNQCCFHVNAHFADLKAPQAFYNGLATAVQQSQPLHYTLSVNLRTLYSGLDMIGRMLGGLNNISIVPLASPDNSSEPFVLLQLKTPSVAVSLLCQNFASEVDDGSATLINHRCSVMFAHGNLLLAETNGPVLWFPTPQALPAESWQTYLPVDLTAADPQQLQQERDYANLQAMQNLVAVAQGKITRVEQQPEYLMSLSRLWLAVLAVLQPS